MPSFNHDYLGAYQTSAVCMLQVKIKFRLKFFNLEWFSISFAFILLGGGGGGGGGGGRQPYGRLESPPETGSSTL